MNKPNLNVYLLIGPLILLFCSTLVLAKESTEAIEEKLNINKFDKEQKGDHDNLEENEISSEDPELPNELNTDPLQGFGSVFLSKLDDELKQKVKSKIGDEKFSIDQSLFEEFTDNEKKQIESATWEALSPLFSKLIEKLSGGQLQNVFSISENAFANFSLGEIDDAEKEDDGENEDDDDVDEKDDVNKEILKDEL